MTEDAPKPRHRITAPAALAVAASLLLFLASLPLDAFFIDRADNPRAWSLGFGLLCIGWVTVLDGVPAWLANPAVFFAWILLLIGFRRSALVSAAVALLLALSFLRCNEILTNEAGDYSRITGYGPGYWVWVSSMGATLVGGIVELVMRRRNVTL